MKGLGILEVSGKEYVILEKVYTLMPEAASRAFLENEGDTHFVARRFSVESAEVRDGELVLSTEDHFLTPRWMTIHGDYVINWFPEPIEVNVEDTWIKQEEK